MGNSNYNQEEIAATMLQPNIKIEDISNVETEEKFENVTLNQISGYPSTSYLIQKRFVDIIGAFMGLLFLSPLLVLLALVIKIEDRKASVLFSQYRVGKDGNIFKMYKFRSMVSNAESQLEELLSLNETTGAMFKMSNDPRVTKVGKFIRKTSLDELPQLWNVLKGEMSLVGPRPALPREVAKYSNNDLQRLSALPGCTGLWQISGRSNIGFDEMVELDLIYIKSRTIWTDCAIILKTVFVLFGSKDAF